MSLADYMTSREIAKGHYPFYALIMEAMRMADSDNAERLRLAFPETWNELTEKYWTTGGLVTAEPGGADA